MFLKIFFTVTSHHLSASLLSLASRLEFRLLMVSLRPSSASLRPCDRMCAASRVVSRQRSRVGQARRR